MWRALQLSLAGVALLVTLGALAPTVAQAAELGNATAIDTCPTASWQVRR